MNLAPAWKWGRPARETNCQWCLAYTAVTPLRYCRRVGTSRSKYWEVWLLPTTQECMLVNMKDSLISVESVETPDPGTPCRTLLARFHDINGHSWELNAKAHSIATRTLVHRALKACSREPWSKYSRNSYLLSAIRVYLLVGYRRGSSNKGEEGNLCRQEARKRYPPHHARY